MYQTGIPRFKVHSMSRLVTDNRRVKFAPADRHQQMVLDLRGMCDELIRQIASGRAQIAIGNENLPQAYASVQFIESLPVANIFRNVHHWAAHVMIATILLHALRVFFTGTYRKPREITWVLGVVLLGLTLAAGFVGYALPWDAFAVTATGIGFGLARSIPVAGHLLSDLFFGGAFPSLGSLPRLYTIHVVVLPLSLLGVTGLHLLLVLKQLGYAVGVAHLNHGLRGANSDGDEQFVSDMASRFGIPSSKKTSGVR